MANYYKSVERWAIIRGLDKADPKAQLNKLMEEVGELAQGMNKNNRDQIIDSLGDVQVVLTVLALQLNLHQEVAFNAAYNVIKSREGSLVNGVFVKDADK
ncbi:MazG-like family protein [Lacticaseibacillus salsurivasis]|uniref:MazG-like family protein n=1 Tax=Lacticaseibacillus salsurivasis TaxID=3081441 RepID=UPI0030C75C47